jgi:hypothetical protein
MRSALRLAGSISVLFLFSGCALRVPPAWKPAPVPSSEVGVFYATNRQLESSEDKACPKNTQPFSKFNFNRARFAGGELSFGHFQITVSPGHRLGQTLPYEPMPRCWRTETHPVYGAGPSLLPKPVFLAAFREALRLDEKQQILLYVHGTRFRFDESVLWAAQFGHDIQFSGPLLVFSWPSGEGRWDYMEGEANSEWARPHFKELLTLLSVEFPDARINVIAHSLGARVVLHMLDEWSKESTSAPRRKLQNLVLAAADIDSEIFRRLLPAARKSSERITVYISADDKALGASARVHGYARLGRDLNGSEGVDIIDTTYLKDSDYNHNYYTQSRRVLFDLFQLIHDNVPPDRRFGLVRYEHSGHIYWQVRP